MTDLLARLGVLLRERRSHLGMSQPVAAERSGVSTRLWSETERGQRPNVSAMTLVRMLSSIGVVLEPSHTGESEADALRRELREAEAAGVDVSMVRQALRQTPQERIASNDDALAFFSQVRVARRAAPQGTGAPRAEGIGGRRRRACR